MNTLFTINRIIFTKIICFYQPVIVLQNKFIYNILRFYLESIIKDK